MHPFISLTHILTRPIIPPSLSISLTTSIVDSWTLIPQLLDEATMLDHERIQVFDFFRSAVINLIRKKGDREGNQDYGDRRACYGISMTLL